MTETKTEKWAIVHITDNFNYIDCGIYQTQTSDNMTKSSWVAIIDKLIPNTFGRYGGMMFNRHFVDSRGFKDVGKDEDAKFVAMEKFKVGDIVELGFKETYNDGYPERPNRYYKYVIIKELIDGEGVLVEIITKEKAMQLLRNTDLDSLKRSLILELEEMDNIDAIIDELGIYKNKFIILKEKEERV